MGIQHLLRKYDHETIDLTMLRRSKYISTVPYKESFLEFVKQPTIDKTVVEIAELYNLQKEYRDNRSSQHIRFPNAVILYYRNEIFIHPMLANAFFFTNYPHIVVHYLRFLEQRTYLHDNSPRNVIYLPLEDGHQEWVKTFTDELYDNFYRFYNMKNTGEKYQHPAFFGHLTNKYIYAQLPLEEAQLIPVELKELRDTDDCESYINKLHQYLNDEGRKILVRTIHRVCDLIDDACYFYQDLKDRKAFLHERLTNIKTGQTSLPIHIHTTTERK